MDGRRGPSRSLEKVEVGSPPRCSSARCCCLLLLFLTLCLAIACLSFFLLLRPKKPVFSLHAIQLESLKLDASPSSKQVYFPPSVASLSFATDNPNRVGIRYTSSELDVLFDDGARAGVIRVPAFYQPPLSRNVTVIMHAVFERLNLTKLVYGGGSRGGDGGRFSVRVTGGVEARSRFMNFPLPKIKVGLDCKISVDYGAISLNKGMNFLKTHEALLLSSFPHLQQKCSLALRL